MDLHWKDYGQRFFVLAWNNQKVDLRQAMNQLGAQFGSPSGEAAYLGAFETMLQMLGAMQQHCKQHGLRIAGPGYEYLNDDIGMLALRVNTALSQRDYRAFERLSAEVLAAVNAWRKSVRVNLGIKQRTRASNSDPMKVEIVGMPARTTSSIVARDENGKITETLQHETDAA